jgi:hypothetical protein
MFPFPDAESPTLLPMRLAFATLVAVSTFTSAAAAQTKAQLLEDWERQRTNVLAYLDAMPDSAMRYRPTPGVRDFAEQILHAVGTNLEVAALALRAEQTVPFTLDTAQVHEKGALRDYTDRVFTYMLDGLKRATPSQLMRQSSVFNLPPQSTTRWLLLSYEHSVWTLGQTVPYLRLNGVTPPGYKQPL